MSGPTLSTGTLFFLLPTASQLQPSLFNSHIFQLVHRVFLFFLLSHRRTTLHCTQSVCVDNCYLISLEPAIVCSCVHPSCYHSVQWNIVEKETTLLQRYYYHSLASEKHTHTQWYSMRIDLFALVYSALRTTYTILHDDDDPHSLSIEKATFGWEKKWVNSPTISLSSSLWARVCRMCHRIPFVWTT